MRTFVYRDATSDKFWHIELKGASFVVSFGRVGTKGQTQEKAFADEETAGREAEKLIREKLKKGYRETTAPAGPAALGQALEDAINENPDDRAAHAAYADWLQEQGDPRGEFISLQLRLEDPALKPAERKALKAREEALLKQHAEAWAGGWVALAPENGPEGRGQLPFPGPKPVGFVRGLPAEATIEQMGEECAEAFVRSPDTRFVRSLKVGGFDYGDEGGGEQILHRWPHFGNLRVFQFGWTSDEEYGDFCHFQCHLDGSPVHRWVERMPRLEELYVFASGADGRAIFEMNTLTNLRVLQLYHSWVCPLEVLAANPAFANLTHLLIHPKAKGDWDYESEAYVTLEGLRAVVASPHLGRLTHLRLRLTRFGDEGVAAVVQSGILKRLRVLDLRHGCVTDEGARLLAACPDVRHLESLDVSRNEMTAAGIAALSATGVKLLAAHQHGSTAREESPEYMHEGDYE